MKVLPRKLTSGYPSSDVVTHTQYLFSSKALLTRSFISSVILIKSRPPLCRVFKLVSFIRIHTKPPGCRRKSASSSVRQARTERADRRDRHRWEYGPARNYSSAANRSPKYP